MRDSLTTPIHVRLSVSQAVALRTATDGMSGAEFIRQAVAEKLARMARERSADDRDHDSDDRKARGDGP
jgi:hypothetical protein